MARYTEKIILRKDARRADGSAPLCLQVFVSGQRRVVALGLFCSPVEFDRSAQRVHFEGKKKQALENLYNSALLDARTRAQKIFIEAQLSGVPLDGPEFVRRFRQHDNPVDFLAFMGAEIKKEREVRAPSTIKNYEKTLRRLMAFRPTLPMSSITGETVRAFDRHLHGKNYETNTVADFHKIFKKFLSIAHRRRLIMAHPYEHFTIKRARTSPEHLRPEQVGDLLTAYRSGELPGGAHLAARHFLFSCFTGLRYGDVKALKWDNVDIGGKLLRFRPLKTRATLKVLAVPLGAVALSLIEDARRDPDPPRPGGFVFRCRALQVTNRHLKTVAERLGLTTALTTHVGRHTFGALFLAAGGHVETLREILGHSDLKTTQVYTHLQDKKRAAGVAALDGLFS